MKLMDMFAAARKVDSSARKEQNALPDKAGNLRAGNTGIVSPDGDVAAACLRIAHLRQLDLDIELLGEDKHLMFDLGLANEEVVAEKLKKTLPEGYMLLREEEIPTQWTTENGTVVSGRPDIVICVTTNNLNPTTNVLQSKPILGIELKSVHSMWTARDVLFAGKPKLSNIAQAAHYMWQLGIPYKLMYTGYSQLGQGMAGQGSGWILKMFPQPGQPMSEHIEYTYYRKEYSTRLGKDTDKKCTREEWETTPNNKRSYSIKQIKQFQVVYDLRIEQDVVQYKLEHETQWKDTIVRIADIRRFYEQASRISTSGALGPRPTTLNLHGEKEGYSSCDYCPLKATCDKHESSGYSKWIQEVTKFSKELVGK